MIDNKICGKIIPQKNVNDIFGAYLLEGAKYDRECEYDIPFIDVPKNIELPRNLVSYNKVNKINAIDRENMYVHFYQKDYTFDGKYGIWNSLIQNENHKRGFNLSKIDGFGAVICPDFSTYSDMPRVMQIWNVFRSRTVGYFLSNLGYNTIPNVRWTDSKSYGYSYAGIRKNSIVAVSTLGCLRSKADRELFLPGLEELIIRKKPKCIILYGSLTDDVSNILLKYNQKYLFFPSEISIAMELKYGNESK